MNALLLDPHGDDAVLFACFTLLAHKPDVVVVLRSQLQEDRGTGITAAMRERETNQAFNEAGVPLWHQWDMADRFPNWDGVERLMREYDADHAPELVFAPQWEGGGHEHHNAVGRLAELVFGDRCRGYMTYRRGYGRSEGATEVVPEPEWIAAKHRALACFESQIAEPSTRPWFMDSLREWIA